MRLVRRLFLQLAPVALAAPFVSRLARAQSYPSRPVRVIVTTGPGGQGDTTARLIAQKLSENLGQSFYVENVVGGGGNIAHGVAARATPDGHTILAAGGAFVANPSLYAKIPYDPHKDFAPITLVCSSTHVLAVHPSVPAHSVGELVAVARVNPGTLSYASAGRGTPAHLAGELFKLAFATDITHVPFNGGGPGVTAAVGGHVPITVSALPTALPHAKAGTLRALALMSAKRSALLPDVPTMAEATGQTLEADILTGLLAPAGTPKEIIDLLHREVARIVAVPEFRERLVALGFEPIASTPAEFADWIKTEIAKWAKVIRDAKIDVQ
jgi:tripartite-type tricarboxylate transporter receptor subunit TctC